MRTRLLILVVLSGTFHAPQSAFPQQTPRLIQFTDGTGPTPWPCWPCTPTDDPPPASGAPFTIG
jgi:hypothetical protein